MSRFKRELGVADRVTGKLSGSLQKFGLDSKMADSLAGDLTTGLGGLTLAAGGLGVSMYALQQAFEFGKQGATVAQTTESFNRFLASVDKGPEYLDEMAAATNDTVDDMTLMSSTLTLVAGTSDELGRAMVGNAPELLRIAKAANKLNPALGSTADLYAQLAYGIKRSSPMRIDDLGLTIKLGEANQKFADRLGKTVEQLTAEEKQMALLEATLEAGDRMIEQVGGNVEAMGDEFAQAETDITNLTNQLKGDTYPIFRDLLGVIVLVLDAFDKLYDALDKIPGGVNILYGGLTALSNAIRDGKKKNEELASATDDTAESMGDLTEQTEDLTDAEAEAAMSTEDLDRAQKALDDTINEIRKSYEGFFGSLSQGIIKHRDLGEAQAQAAEDYEQSLADLQKKAKNVYKDVELNFEESLPDRTSVQERMGMAADAWDEWALRIDTIIQDGVESPWYAALQQMGLQKPPDIGVREWAADLKSQFYEGELPELINKQADAWIENTGKMKAAQEEATANYQAEVAKRKAAVQEEIEALRAAREAELEAEREARNEATLELALTLAEQSGMLQAWSQQRFGPDFSQVADTAEEVIGLLESGMLDIDAALEGIISRSVGGVQTALDTTGEQAEKTKDQLDDILSQDWTRERSYNMHMIGMAIEESIDDEPFTPMMNNFVGAQQNILDGAIQMGLNLDSTFQTIDSQWAATVKSQVETWDDGMGEVAKAIQERVIDKLNEIPREIVIRVTTEQTGYEEGGGGGEGYQHGGQFTVGGASGTDRVPVHFMASRGEIVTVTPPGHAAPGPSINLNFGNTTISSGMDEAAFFANVEMAVSRAMQGV